jgi:K+-transporting ATPase ATPase A chain
VTDGTLPTGTPLFAGLAIATILVLSALSYLPVLALGPLVEQLGLR